MEVDESKVAKNGHLEFDLESSSQLSSLLGSTDREFLFSSSDVQLSIGHELKFLQPRSTYQHISSIRSRRVKISELEGKIIGLYFSANWYPPCRTFTHLLVNVYNQLKTRGSNFEVVFVSSDEDVAAFNEYRAIMPWLAIPYSDLETKRGLSHKFDVEAIPCLVILQPGDGSEGPGTMHDGVELIYRYGARAFPFTRERLEELRMEDKEREERQNLVNLLTNNGREYLFSHPSSTQVPVASMEGKTIGLYFSAQWCLPGVRFTPKLISIYHKIKQTLSNQTTNEDFEIVFVSSDHDQTSYDSYFNTMPWLALPFRDPTARTLAKYFDIRGIPCLVILGPDGKTVTRQGRNLVNLYQENAYPFTKEKVEMLEREMDELAQTLPRSKFHVGHHHELTLVSEGTGGGPFICCDCDEQGSGWAYQCLECGYEVHPRCVRAVDRRPVLDR